MSFKCTRVHPPNPNTTRGAATKLSSNGDKIVYANGRSIVVRSQLSSVLLLCLCPRRAQIKDISVSTVSYFVLHGAWTELCVL